MAKRELQALVAQAAALGLGQEARQAALREWFIPAKICACVLPGGLFFLTPFFTPKP